VERTIEVIGWLYDKAGSNHLVLEHRILEKIIRALKDPMCTKHSCNSSSLWKLSATCFIRILNVGIPLARETPEYFVDFWPFLGTLLEEFLFSE